MFRFFQSLSAILEVTPFQCSQHSLTRICHVCWIMENQFSEFTRLMGMVKLENHEELVISSCQRLVLILREFPNQKSRLISRHGLIPLMDMLETSSTRVRNLGLLSFHVVFRLCSSNEFKRCSVSDNFKLH